MSKMNNPYRIDKENGIAIFEIRNKQGNKNTEFIIDLEDFDIVYPHKWHINRRSSGSDDCGIDTYIMGQHTNIVKVIAHEYVDSDRAKSMTYARLNAKVLDFRKTNILESNDKGDIYLKRGCTTRRTNRQHSFAHFTSVVQNESTRYLAIIMLDKSFASKGSVSKTFSEPKVSHAKERAIYAAYLFEKEYYGDDFSIDEYLKKEKSFSILTTWERAEVEDAIVDQLGELKVARKNIFNYRKSLTLAAKITRGEIEQRVQKFDHKQVQLRSTNHISPSKQTLFSIANRQSDSWYPFVANSGADRNKSYRANGNLPSNAGCFSVQFSISKYCHAKEMAIYAAYLFEKLVYGDNFPESEYARSLDAIKMLSIDEINIVNEKVAGKLEKVYTVLKEMTSEKLNACEQPQEVDAEKSADEFLEQIKQVPLKDDALETAAVDDELFAERFKRIEIPERNKLAIQQAIAELKQKPSLFQRIKNWFAN